jgi:hypothetical protein
MNADERRWESSGIEPQMNANQRESASTTEIGWPVVGRGTVAVHRRDWTIQDAHSRALAFIRG